MAITAAQRSEALQLVVTAAAQGPGAPPLNLLLPGVQPVDVLNALVGAIGTNFDTQLTTALANYVTALNGQLATEQQSVTQTQALIAGATVV